MGEKPIQLHYLDCLVRATGPPSFSWVVVVRSWVKRASWPDLGQSRAGWEGRNVSGLIILLFMTWCPLLAFSETSDRIHWHRSQSAIRNRNPDPWPKQWVLFCISHFALNPSHGPRKRAKAKKVVVVLSRAVGIEKPSGQSVEKIPLSLFPKCISLHEWAATTTQPTRVIGLLFEDISTSGLLVELV